MYGDYMLSCPSKWEPLARLSHSEVAKRTRFSSYMPRGAVALSPGVEVVGVDSDRHEKLFKQISEEHPGEGKNIIELLVYAEERRLEAAVEAEQETFRKELRDRKQRDALRRIAAMELPEFRDADGKVIPIGTPSARAWMLEHHPDAYQRWSALLRVAQKVQQEHNVARGEEDKRRRRAQTVQASIERASKRDKQLRALRVAQEESRVEAVAASTARHQQALFSAAQSSSKRQSDTVAKMEAREASASAHRRNHLAQREASLEARRQALEEEMTHVATQRHESEQSRLQRHEATVAEWKRTVSDLDLQQHSGRGRTPPSPRCSGQSPREVALDERRTAIMAKEEKTAEAVARFQAAVRKRLAERAQQREASRMLHEETYDKHLDARLKHQQTIRVQSDAAVSRHRQARHQAQAQSRGKAAERAKQRMDDAKRRAAGVQSARERRRAERASRGGNRRGSYSDASEMASVADGTADEEPWTTVERMGRGCEESTDQQLDSSTHRDSPSFQKRRSIAGHLAREAAVPPELRKAQTLAARRQRLAERERRWVSNRIRAMNVFEAKQQKRRQVAERAATPPREVCRRDTKPPRSASPSQPRAESRDAVAKSRGPTVEGVLAAGTAAAAPPGTPRPAMSGANTDRQELKLPLKPVPPPTATAKGKGPQGRNAELEMARLNRLIREADERRDRQLKEARLSLATKTENAMRRQEVMVDRLTEARLQNLDSRIRQAREEVELSEERRQAALRAKQAAAEARRRVPPLLIPRVPQPPGQEAARPRYIRFKPPAPCIDDSFLET